MDGILFGFEVALTPVNLLFVTLGALLGTVVGLLPGLGPTAAIAVLLPLTYGMDPATAVIFLAGIFYGSMFGGRIPAILLNVPGDASAVITTLDGYPLQKKGKAGLALGVTAVGSFAGGIIALIGVTLFIPVLSDFALSIGAPELFLLALVGLLMVTFLSSGALSKSLLGALMGILIAVIGFDSINGSARFTYGNFELMDGIHIVPLAVGLFGLSELLVQAEQRFKAAPVAPVGSPWPKLSELNRVKGAVGRASIVGFLLGLIPGGGGAMASVVSYGIQKKFSKAPEMFGKGAMDGLASTETSDNAAANSSFVPLLTLGIPPNPVIALIGAALILHGITPGPDLVNSNPDVFWGLIASMFVGTIILFILNVPLIGVFVQILKIPPLPLGGAIVLLSVAGTYSLRGSLFDVGLLGIFAFLGYALRKVGVPSAPIVLGFILAPIMESELRRSLYMSGGSLEIFISRPLSLAIVVGIASLGAALLIFSRKGRKKGIARADVLSGNFNKS